MGKAYYIDVINSRFGKLVVIDKTDKYEGGTQRLYECKCDCGNTVYIRKQFLLNGSKTHCGCERLEARLESMVNQRFGYLRVNKLVSHNKGIYLWECKCDCGNIVNVANSSLLRGHTKSCGCYKQSVNYVDITNKRFGKLVALEIVENKIKDGYKVWLCRCDCGSFTEVKYGALQSGNTKSCGCFKKEKSIKDITNMRFGKLVAVKPTSERKWRRVVWECKCDCGNERKASSEELYEGLIKSCGKCNK